MKKNTSNLKVALVTGAARRIGAEIAKTLHASGMNIVLHYNTSEEDAFNLSDELNRIRQNSAIRVRTDLSQSESAKFLIQKTAEAWQRLDVLINNASRFYRTNLGKITEYAWDDLMNSNLKAPFFLSQAAAPLLATHEGVIINIADIHAEVPLHDYSIYCISKGALISMTKVLSKELGPQVRVNAVSPGTVVWPEGENSLSSEEKQRIIARTVLQRPGSATDIAKAVLFLVRDGNYITGQVLVVDGGRMF